jgi:hypothetical protein
MRGQALNYKARSGAAMGQTIERIATPLAWVLAAALIGWAIAIALGIWGDRALAKQAPWRPFAIDVVTSPRIAATTNAPSAQPTGALQLFGIADERAYFKSGAKSLSVAEGDTLPSGEKVRRITRDTVVLLAASGETTIALFKPQAVKGAVAAANPAAVATNAAQGCRLNAADRAAATWIEPSVATALAGESKAFARMFNVIDPVRGGLRAQATGGTTAMFAIADGDVLLRADGQALRAGEAIATEIIGKVQRGDAVVVEGERAGAARRWVFAPVSCRT